MLFVLFVSLLALLSSDFMAILELPEFRELSKVLTAKV
jgi:hypothetical protein